MLSKYTDDGLADCKEITPYKKVPNSATAPIAKMEDGTEGPFATRLTPITYMHSSTAV